MGQGCPVNRTSTANRPRVQASIAGASFALRARRLHPDRWYRRDVSSETRLIFLDIDGVLNSAPFLVDRDGLDHDQQIDPRAVERLNTLVRRSDAKVVISSSWRCHLPLDRIQDILCGHGFQGEIIGATPRRTPNRAAEIQAWLDAAEDKPEALVILDDLPEMNHLAPYFVQTSFEEGLLDQHVEDALLLLGVV